MKNFSKWSKVLVLIRMQGKKYRSTFKKQRSMLFTGFILMLRYLVVFFIFLRINGHNKSVRDAFGFVEALPFVPESDVVFAFMKIKSQFDSNPKIVAFLDHFEEYYVGPLKENSRKFRKVPLFKLDY